MIIIKSTIKIMTIEPTHRHQKECTCNSLWVLTDSQVCKRS